MRRNESEITDMRIIEEIINNADVCRIAMANNNIPYLVTMNFGYLPGMDPKMFFHCANAGKKLDMINKNKSVCFELDTDHQLHTGERGCDWGMSYSSVVGYGNISIVNSREDKIFGLNCIMSHYGGNKKFTYNEKILSRTLILQLDIKEISGKKC
jgi:uncharacterized protein